MTDKERNKVFEILRGAIVEDKTTADCLATIAISDTYNLEPFIDDLVEQSFRAGKLAILLERSWEVSQSSQTRDL